MSLFEGKVVVIIGVGLGIGRVLVFNFFEKCVKFVFFDVDIDGLVKIVCLV